MTRYFPIRNNVFFIEVEMTLKLTMAVDFTNTEAN